MESYDPHNHLTVDELWSGWGSDSDSDSEVALPPAPVARAPEPETPKTQADEATPTFEPPARGGCASPGITDPEDFYGGWSSDEDTAGKSVSEEKPSSSRSTEATTGERTPAARAAAKEEPKEQLLPKPEAKDDKILKSILDLPALIDSLPKDQKARFTALYSAAVETGTCTVPPPLLPSVERWFGRDGLDRVQTQRVVSILNQATCEEARFNALRAGRPQPRTGASDAAALAKAADEALYEATCGASCDFCAPEQRTAADRFGRVYGRAGCVTACNLAKAAGDHALVLAPEHHPLRAARQQAVVVDVIQTAQRWAVKAVQARGPVGNGAEDWHPTLLWNCGMGSGASQPHAHAQVILTYGRHPGRAELLRRAGDAHTLRYGRGYWTDVQWCHRIAGLVTDYQGAVITPNMTPCGHRELLVFGRDAEILGKGIYAAGEVLMRRFGARCWNVGATLSPVDIHAEPHPGSTLVARVVDRTDKPDAAGGVYATSFASFELYGPVVESVDAVETAEAVAEVVQELVREHSE